MQNEQNGQNGNFLKKASFLETWSGKSTRWIGSTQSLIAHTALFIIFFFLGFEGYDWGKILLILTTIVSLEAIYLSIFIQMTINRNTMSLEEVEEGLGEIQENIDEISSEEEGGAPIDSQTKATLQRMEGTLQKLIDDFQKLQNKNNNEQK